MVTLYQAVLLVHLVATLFMTGVIWFVQVVHYPLKSEVGASAFQTYQREHLRRTTWLVAPPMIVEALSAAALVGLAGSGEARVASAVGLLLLFVIWGSTAGFQVPSHAILERQGFVPQAHRRLVLSNWIRTLAWSIRGVLACWMCFGAAMI